MYTINVTYKRFFKQKARLTTWKIFQRKELLSSNRNTEYSFSLPWWLQTPQAYIDRKLLVPTDSSATGKNPATANEQINDQAMQDVSPEAHQSSILSATVTKRGLLWSSVAIGPVYSDIFPDYSYSLQQSANSRAWSYIFGF